MEINKYIDHTALKSFCTDKDVEKLCYEAVKYNFKSVCVNPVDVPLCYKILKDTTVKVCTVIGFPLGKNTTAVKVYEAINAINNGATELDMVINVGDLRSNRLTAIREEISAIKKACGNKILKVIIETCLLTEEEKIIMCNIVTEAGADYIKTSTGFSTAGATREDVKLMREHVGKHVKVKAAGGIKDLTDAEDFINLGADRLGTSRVVKAVKGLKEDGTY